MKNKQQSRRNQNKLNNGHYSLRNQKLKCFFQIEQWRAKIRFSESVKLEIFCEFIKTMSILKFC